jgi:hypothetical protein
MIESINYSSTQNIEARKISTAANLLLNNLAEVEISQVSQNYFKHCPSAAIREPGHGHRGSFAAARSSTSMTCDRYN